ncbi:MAG: ABC transporter permease [Lachnospiraceae bacterium]|nr:ABC transporter permease [Lachnospiraceae bacterium]
MSKRLLIYELKNMNGNFMVHFFGVIFPCFMSAVMTKAIGDSVPESMYGEVVTSIMLSMIMIIPMAICLIGYGCVYAGEVEKGIPLRMHLFGYDEKTLIGAKLIVHLLFMTAALIIYALFQMVFMDIQSPKPTALVCLLLFLYLIAACLLVLAHAIANLIRRFNIAYGILLGSYFFFMIISGMVGIQTSQLPKWLQVIAKALPMTYICNDYIDFWQGRSFPLMSFIQALIFFAALSGVLLIVSLYREKRVIK